MRKKTNFKELSLLLQDIEQQTAAHPTFALFNRDKIKEFYSSNHVRIEELGKRSHAMMADRVKMDPMGKPVIIVTNQGPQIQFKSEEDKTAYQKEYWDLLNEEIWLSL